jgi:hypothetical protein
VKSIEITPHLKVGLRVDGKIMTIIGKKQIVQCRHVIVTIPIDETVHSIDELLSKYTNKEETAKVRITPEEELIVHASSIGAWVDSDYDPRCCDTRIAWPLIAELVKVDPAAITSFLSMLGEAWNDSTDEQRRLLMKSYQKFVHYLGKCGTIAISMPPWVRGMPDSWFFDGKQFSPSFDQSLLDPGKRKGMPFHDDGRDEYPDCKDREAARNSRDSCWRAVVSDVMSYVAYMRAIGTWIPLAGFKKNMVIARSVAGMVDRGAIDFLPVNGWHSKEMSGIVRFSDGHHEHAIIAMSKRTHDVLEHSFKYNENILKNQRLHEI